jgi:hypothetical protein
MRTTADLIEELDERAMGFQVAAIIVAFEDSSTPVFARDENRHTFLNDAVTKGGIPIGLIALKSEGHALTYCTQAYPEHDEKSAQETLSRFVEVLSAQLKRPS